MKNNLIELPVSELREALPGLGKLIGRKTTLPVLSAVRVARDNTGLLTLQATDLDSFATFTLKERSEGPVGHVLVPFDRLQKAVKQSNSKIELSMTNKDEVIIRTFWRDTPMEEKVGVPYHDDWPKMPVVDTEAVALENRLRATFKEAMECASEDAARQVINSVYLDVEDKKGHYVVATNGRHLFSANSFAFGFKQSVIIPTRKFLAWNGWWTEGEATLAIKPPTKKEDWPWLQFEADQWTFLTRGCAEPYPKWKNVVPTEDPKTTIIIPEQAVASVLEVLARLPGHDGYNNSVTLNASRTTLVLSGRDKEQSQPVAMPIVEAQIKGLPVAVALNRAYVMRALRFGLNTLEIQDELTPVVFSAKGKKMIICPLRPGGDAPAKAATPDQPSTPPPQPAATNTTTPPTETSTQPVQPEERTTMPKQTTTTTNTTTAPAPATEQQESPLKQLLHQIENIKTTLKAVIADLGMASDMLKKADKEKRLADKEVESIREKVREIQSVTI